MKSLPSLASLDSAFQLQEYISLLIRLDVHDVEAITSLPGKRAGKEKEVDIEGDKSDDSEYDERGKNEPTVDEACWIYEQLRCACRFFFFVSIFANTQYKTVSAGFDSSFDNYATTGMHARVVS